MVLTGLFRFSIVRLSIVGAGLLLLSCGGLLSITEGACTKDGDCGQGLVCSDETCIASRGPCSAAIIDGHCPPGRSCSAGVCLLDKGPLTSWCACSPDEDCDRGVCVDSVAGCSVANPGGACGANEVCVSGGCILVAAGANDCSPQRPMGLCPSASACLNGFCIPIADQPCGPAGGLCNAGQECTSGRCQIAPCSTTAPFGTCDLGLVCVRGDCLDPRSLLTCADLDCPSLNRQGCDDSGPFAVCLDCVAGYHANGPLCVADTCVDLNCEARQRVCDESGATAVCGACSGDYVEDATSTAEPKECRAKTCAELDCGALNRVCDASATEPDQCGTCVPSFVDGPGEACVVPTCAALACGALNRECVGTPPAPQSCGACVSDFSEFEGRCVQCKNSAECPGQAYCAADGTCQSDCTSGAAPDTCLSGEQCSPHGRCFPVVANGEYCAVGQAAGQREIPTIVLLVDQSGSMKDEYGDPEVRKWDSLHTALFNDPSGVVRALHDEVAFGLTTYTRTKSACPKTVVVNPQLGNLGPMQEEYDKVGTPAGGTPTSFAVEEVAATLRQATDERKQYIVLATDGAPNGCKNQGGGTIRVVDKVQAAYQDDDISTFALFIGSPNEDILRHMQQVANVGAGFKRSGSDGTAPFFVANDAAELSAKLSAIIRSVLSCSVRLNTTGQKPLRGEVFLDGDLVPADQWIFTSNTTLELLGDSCTVLKDGEDHFVGARFDFCGGGG